MHRRAASFGVSPTRAASRTPRSRTPIPNLGSLRQSTLAEPIGERLRGGHIPPSVTTALFRSGAERVPVDKSNESQQQAAVDALRRSLQKIDTNNVGIVTPQELWDALQHVSHRLHKHLVDGIKQDLRTGAPDQGILYNDLLTSLEEQYLPHTATVDLSGGIDGSSKGGPLWALQKCWSLDPAKCWKLLEHAILEFRKFDSHTLRHVMVQLGIVATGTQVSDIFSQLGLDAANSVEEVCAEVHVSN